MVGTSPAWTRTARRAESRGGVLPPQGSGDGGSHPARGRRHLPGLLLRRDLARLRGLPAARRRSRRRRWAGRTRSRTRSWRTTSRPRPCSRSASTTSCSRPSRVATRSACTWRSAAGSARRRRSARTSSSAYHRMVKAAFLAAAGAPLPTDPADYPPPPPSYPEPVEHCGICRWDIVCSARRRADDHLSLVAGIARAHPHGARRAGHAHAARPGRAAAAALPRLAHTSAERCCASGSRRASRSRARTPAAVIHELLEPSRTTDGALDTSKGLLALPAAQPGRHLP